jgi:hypothetical protein
MSGRSLLLQAYADAQGLPYTQVDCLEHFNLTKLTSVLNSLARQPQLVELTNFEHYNLLVDSGQAAQSKSVRDLQEARFAAVVHAQLASFSGVKLVATVEKPD